MKVFAVLSILAVSAVSGARLDNRYVPPPANAQSAGGYNLDAPKLALPSNVQNTYSAPQQQTHYQQQSVQRPGLNQGTYTQHSSGNGFQSVSAGSFVSSGNAPNFQRPAYNQQKQYQQPAYQQPQQATYQPQQQQSSYQPSQPAQSNYYQKDTYNQASTTPIPILKCKLMRKKKLEFSSQLYHPIKVKKIQLTIFSLIIFIINSRERTSSR